MIPLRLFGQRNAFVEAGQFPSDFPCRPQRAVQCLAKFVDPQNHIGKLLAECDRQAVDHRAGGTFGIRRRWGWARGDPFLPEKGGDLPVSGLTYVNMGRLPERRKPEVSRRKLRNVRLP